MAPCTLEAIASIERKAQALLQSAGKQLIADQEMGQLIACILSCLGASLFESLIASLFDCSVT